MTALITTAALRAQDLIQSIGVCAHLTSTISSYGNVANIQSQLSYLGVDHVRTEAPDMSLISAYQTLGAAGTKFDLIVMNDPASAMPVLNVLAPYIDLVEGPNEVDITIVHYQGLVGAPAAIALQKDLYADTHASKSLNNASKSTPVLNFTVSLGNSYAPYGDMSAYADYTNVHAYATDGSPALWFIQQEIADVTDTHGLPVIVTETGNFTMPTTENGVTRSVEAKLVTYSILDDFKNGVVSTYIYQLEDGFSDPNNLNSEDHYGLFEADGTPKLGAIAVHNLTTILVDTGANAQTFTTTPLSYAVTNLPYSATQFVLQKSTGVYEIALWNETRIWNSTTLTEIALVPATVTVTLDQVYQTINVYDTITSSSPVATYHNVSSVNVALAADAMIIEVIPNSVGRIISTGTAGGVFVSTGADTIVAGSGNATINASGAANITGATGTLTANLTGSAALVSGGAGVLTVNSNSGSNTITGGTGALRYTGLASTDVITTGTSTTNKLVLGGGTDVITVIGNATVTGGAGAASITLRGSGASIVGGAGVLQVADQGGSHTVIGGTGAFTYVGTTGTDSITTGKSSANTVILGAGSDTVSILASTVLTAGTGAAKIMLTSSGSSITGGLGALTATDSSGGNTITGGAGALNLTMAATALGNTVITNNTTGLSIVQYRSGSNVVMVNGMTSIDAGLGSGNLVVSGSGQLSINGGSGSMTVNGGTGTAYIFTQLNTKNLVNMSSGSGTVASHGADTINASTVSGAAGERVYIAVSATVTGGTGTLAVNGLGSGAISVTGATGTVTSSALGNNSFIKGGSNGGNVLNAAGGNTTLVGGGAGDKLTDTGTAGGNLLLASAGGASLSAGSGNDTLAGGAGSDIFILTHGSAAHSTVIQGYTAGADHLSFVGFGTASPIASQAVIGGSLQLILSDQTTVTLTNVTKLT